MIDHSMDKYNLIDEKEALFALNEGFIEICGDKHRTFIEDIGSEVVKLGKINGERWVNELIRKSSRLSSFKYLKDDELIKANTEIRLFLEDDQISFERGNYVEIHPSRYMDNIDKLQKRVIKNIKDGDLKMVGTKHFDYFKKFGLSTNPKLTSVSLYSESGLGLDQFKVNNLKYYKEERELFYMVEAIVYKYHYLGMLLKRQEILLEWIDKIKNNMTNDMNHCVKSTLSEVIYNLSIDSVSDIIIEDIQNITGVTEDFMTNDQVSDSLKNIAKDIANKLK